MIKPPGRAVLFCPKGAVYYAQNQDYKSSFEKFFALRTTAIAVSTI